MLLSDAVDVKAWIQRFPIISYGLAALVAGIGITGLESLGSGYDDSSVGTFAILLGFVWNVVAFPYYCASEMLFSFNDGRAVRGHDFIVAVIGLSAFALGEWGYQRWSKQPASAAERLTAPDTKPATRSPRR